MIANFRKVFRTQYTSAVPAETSSDARSTSQRIGLLLGPILFFVTLFLDLDPSGPEVTRMAAVAVLMATWWITDAIPLSATALLPLVLYPLLGIMKTRECAPIYVNSIDGDQYDDLAIGAPNEVIGAVAGAGAVFVVYGSAAGLGAGPRAAAPRGRRPAHPEHDRRWMPSRRAVG